MDGCTSCDRGLRRSRESGPTRGTRWDGELTGSSLRKDAFGPRGLQVGESKERGTGTRPGPLPRQGGLGNETRDQGHDPT